MQLDARKSSGEQAAGLPGRAVQRLSRIPTSEHDGTVCLKGFSTKACEEVAVSAK